VTALVGAELLKARTTRTALGLALGLVALIALFVTVTTIVEDSSNAHPTRDALATLGFVPLFALLFGILAVTGEWRHGTISQTLLVTPKRERMVAAKLVSGAIVGVVLAVVGAVLALVIAAIGLPANGLDFDSGEAFRVAGEALVAGALWGALGAAFATTLPNQVGAIIGALAWLFVVESIISGLWPRVGQWLPGGAANGLIHTGDGVHLSVAAAIVVTLGYVALLAAAGIVLVRRRDITAS
jgi:ABC-2 type transport system permease protein